VALALETARPADFGNATPAEQLKAFRDRVRASSKITPHTFTDHQGQRIERTFDGERIACETWPLLENPWMRQEWDGNLTLEDGATTRVYDVSE
jgi:hypothetical protein